MPNIQRRKGIVPALLALLTIGAAHPVAYAAFEDRGPVPVSTGVGGAQAGDALAFTSRSLNPSSGSWRKAWGLHAAWANRFGLAELSQMRVDVSGPLGGGWSAGAWGMGLGGAAYEERAAGLTLSKAAGNTFAVGIGFSWSGVRIDRYGSDGAVSLDAGITFRHRFADFGLAGSNLISGTLDRFGGSAVPRRIAFGFALPLDEGARILMDYLWSGDEPGALRAGLEIRVYGPIQLRTGWNGQTQQLAIGLGVGVGNWSANTAWDHHPYLGWSQGAGILWEPDHGLLP